MSKRTSNRDRIAKLERFVQAWDDFIAASQHANTMNPSDPAAAEVRQRVAQKRDAVSRARAVLG